MSTHLEATPDCNCPFRRAPSTSTSTHAATHLRTFTNCIFKASDRTLPTFITKTFVCPYTFNDSHPPRPTITIAVLRQESQPKFASSWAQNFRFSTCPSSHTRSDMRLRKLAARLLQSPRVHKVVELLLTRSNHFQLQSQSLNPFLLRSQQSSLSQLHSRPSSLSLLRSQSPNASQRQARLLQESSHRTYLLPITRIWFSKQPKSSPS